VTFLAADPAFVGVFGRRTFFFFGWVNLLFTSCGLPWSVKVQLLVLLFGDTDWTIKVPAGTIWSLEPLLEVSADLGGKAPLLPATIPQRRASMLKRVVLSSYVTPLLFPLTVSFKLDQVGWDGV